VSLPSGSVKALRAQQDRAAVTLDRRADQEFTDRTTNLGELRRRIGCNGMARMAPNRTSVASGMERAASIASSTGL